MVFKLVVRVLKNLAANKTKSNKPHAGVQRWRTSFRLPLLGLSCALATVACTWVKPVEQAENVSLVPQKYADDCRLLGQTESNVKDSVGILKRRETKVEEELATLAKNAAAAMGGDTIAAKGEPVEGKQAFSIYRCSE